MKAFLNNNSPFQFDFILLEILISDRNCAFNFTIHIYSYNVFIYHTYNRFVIVVGRYNIKLVSMRLPIANVKIVMQGIGIQEASERSKRKNQPLLHIIHPILKHEKKGFSHFFLNILHNLVNRSKWHFHFVSYLLLVRVFFIKTNVFHSKIRCHLAPFKS